MTRMFFPKRLVFSGGGTRCLVFIPTLLELEKKRQLQYVKEWWGTSAGSLLASLLALTKSVERVDKIMKKTNFTRFRDVNLMNLVQLTSAWGLDDGQSLQAEIERVLEMAKAGSSRYRMRELEGLSIFVCDLHDQNTVRCSAETVPDMRLVDVIRASMSLPLFYTPFRNPANNHVWVDGCVDVHFPWVFLLTQKAKEESLGFSFQKSWMTGPRTFSEYMFSMLYFKEPDRIRMMQKEWPKNIVWFPSPPFPSWYVNLKSDDFTLLEQLSIQGYQTWLKACSSETLESHPLSEDQSIPPLENRQHCTNGMLGIQKCSFLPQQPYPRQDSHMQIPPLSRRWSV